MSNRKLDQRILRGRCRRRATAKYSARSIICRNALRRSACEGRRSVSSQGEALRLHSRALGCFQRPAIVLFFIQPLDGRLGLLVAAHLDETKTLAAADFPIFNHLGTFGGAESSKQLFQIGATALGWLRRYSFDASLHEESRRRYSG